MFENCRETTCGWKPDFAVIEVGNAQIEGKIKKH
jgi:hypothetical protein